MHFFLFFFIFFYVLILRVLYCKIKIFVRILAFLFSFFLKKIASFFLNFQKK